MESKRYFESRFFKRLFFSYVLVIVAFMLVYGVWYAVSYSTRYAQDTEAACQQQVTAYATTMDQQFFDAQSMIAAINSSESFRTIFQSAYVEQKTIDSMQYYRLQREFKRIRGSSNNMNIYSVMCCFQQDNKVYMPGGVIDFIGSPQMLQGEARPFVDTVARLLGVTNHSQMMFNKEYLIYADNYTAFSENMPQGIVMVLFEESGLEKLTENVLGSASGASILCDGEPLMDFGQLQGRTFEAPSRLLSSRVSYRFYVPEAVFRAPFASSVIVPLGGVLLLGIIFMLMTYGFSRQFYKPIGSMSQMVEPQLSSGDDMDDLLRGISSLIGERNGYREKMITISPYVQQGIVHSLISGGPQNQHPSLLTDSEFFELKKTYFTVALVNIVGTGDRSNPPQYFQDAQSLIRHVCQEATTDEQNVVCCSKNLQNLYVIVNSDEAKGMDAVFYSLYTRIREAIDDPRLAVTIGVSATQSDLNSLRAACDKAQNALNQMLIGGRGCVYFDDSSLSDDARSYYFPRDTYKRMVKNLKEGNIEELYAQLDDLYRHNMQEAELPLSEIEMMLDELHDTLSTALRTVYDRSLIHVRLERLRDTMTIDEIFAYYKTVFDTALSNLGSRPGQGSPDETEQKICDYIEAHYCDSDLSLNSLAEHFGVSTKVIGTICKKHYDTTFLQYVRERQIHRAAELLQGTSLSLEEIAQQCGFINVLTFRRNFKAVMNMNPSDFRR